ncbi:MAG: MFS transporter, partial [Pseudomonas sp.]|nr:MFS transporter [Pseudomonas sp.]
ALAVFVGLEAVPLFLLALSTLVLFYLYRIPRQLG